MKNKYIIKSIISMTLLVLVFTSCEDILDQPPTSQISDDIFWKTNADAELGIAAIYDGMQKAYRVKHFIWGEFRSDNYRISTNTSAETEALITNTLTSDYSDPLEWSDLYTMILRANIAIAKIPNIPQHDPNLLGQAYALRAFAYFDAYRVWGGVPIFKDGNSVVFDENSIKPRSTAAEVLDLVLADLAEANRLITVPKDSYRFSKASILAFQARVFMHLHRYQDANDALQTLITTGGYTLANNRDTWRYMFLNDPLSPGVGQTGPELILSIFYKSLEDGNRASGVWETYYEGVPSYFVSTVVNTKWVNKFPTTQGAWESKYPGIDPPIINPLGGFTYGDWRYYETMSLRSTSPTRNTEWDISKYAKSNNSPKDDDTNIILFRYSDMILLKAEAENQLNNPTAALALVDQVRKARQLPLVNTGAVPDIDINDKVAFENFILDERQLELMAEGSRWWDLVRTNKVVDVLGPINGQTDATLLWPIFSRHLIDNPKLVQNTPYN